MKKISLLICVIFAGLMTFAQENNGTVYSRHPAIDKTKKLWAAFVKGDKETFGSFLADSMVGNYNYSGNNQKKADYIKGIDWWASEFENLKIADDSPAFPDAIDYKTGGLWVQDWLRVTATHKKSGINLDLPMHNLYRFDKNGKIDLIVSYFNTEPFTAINESAMTRENGKIYINHPYITSVRKLINAYCARDLAAMLPFYSAEAQFNNATMKWNASVNLDQRKKELAADFDKMEKISMKQIGYPDCIYYEKDNAYAVLSCWVWTAISKGKKTEMPVMLYMIFDQDGKIIYESSFYSTNHFE